MAVAADSLSTLLQETSLACQKCLSAVGGAANQGSQSSHPHAATPIGHVEIELVERLKCRCRELENQLAVERQQRSKQLADFQQRHTDDIILQYKQRIKTTEDEKLALVEENRRLRVELTNAEQLRSTLTDQVHRLQVELSRHSASGSQTSSGTTHRIQLLEEQLRQLHKDLESEKRDRVTAQAKVNELQYQLATASGQMQQPNLLTMQSIAERREAALRRYRDEYESTSAHSDNVGAQRRSPDSEGFDEIDGIAVTTNAH
jgi:chromosome segregation ATPase